MSTPTRRTAPGFSVSAFAVGLSAPALASAAASHPDAELIRLGRDLNEASARQAEAWAIAAREQTTEANKYAEASYGPASAIVDQIEILHATTLEGLKVKHQAVCWCWCGEPLTAEALADDDQPCTDMRLLAGLLDDLAAMGSTVA